MIPKSLSDPGCEFPGNVFAFADSLCDHLHEPRLFWLGRGDREKFTPRQRFILMCLVERLQHRYRWSVACIAVAFGCSHGSLFGRAIGKKADALFGLYPDLQRAVVHLDGYKAGQFILDTWNVPIKRVCGE